MLHDMHPSSPLCRPPQTSNMTEVWPGLFPHLTVSLLWNCVFFFNMSNLLRGEALLLLERRWKSSGYCEENWLWLTRVNSFPKTWEQTSELEIKDRLLITWQLTAWFIALIKTNFLFLSFFSFFFEIQSEDVVWLKNKMSLIIVYTVSSFARDLTDMVYHFSEAMKTALNRKRKRFPELSVNISWWGPSMSDVTFSLLWSDMHWRNAARIRRN